MKARWLAAMVAGLLLPVVGSATTQQAEASCARRVSTYDVSESCRPEVDAPPIPTKSKGKHTKSTTQPRAPKARPVCAFMRNGQCEQAAVCTTPGGTAGAYYAVYTDGGKIPGRVCLPPDDPRRPAPGITDALVARAVQRLDWTTPTLTIQPPGGRTLVNLPTNVYADGRTQRLTVTLLTQPVTIEVTPTTYTWDFGDGTTLTTRTPGRPYPDLDVTHPYPRVGTYPIRLTTTLTGRYRTPTTPWADIPGVLRLTTAPQPLRVIEATPQLRGY